VLSLFTEKKLQDWVQYKEGLTTANNNLFLRCWYEVNTCGSKWIPYNKGGSYRKWYGNNQYIINWLNDGELIKKYPGSSFRNPSFQRKQGGTFSALSSGSFSARYSVVDAAFDSKGTMFFSDYLLKAIGYMNSKVFNNLLEFVCPTLDFRFGTLQQLPFLIANIDDLVEMCIDISQKDWDSHESSRWFMKHPFV
jgi:hypothetical protein